MHKTQAVKFCFSSCTMLEKFRIAHVSALIAIFFVNFLIVSYRLLWSKSCLHAFTLASIRHQKQASRQHAQILLSLSKRILWSLEITAIIGLSTIKSGEVSYPTNDRRSVVPTFDTNDAKPHPGKGHFRHCKIPWTKVSFKGSRAITSQIGFANSTELYGALRRLKTTLDTQDLPRTERGEYFRNFSAWILQEEWQREQWTDKIEWENGNRKLEQYCFSISWEKFRLSRLMQREVCGIRILERMLMSK